MVIIHPCKFTSRVTLLESCNILTPIYGGKLLGLLCELIIILQYSSHFLSWSLLLGGICNTFVDRVEIDLSIS